MEPTTTVAVYSGLDLPALSITQTFVLLLVLLPSAALAGWWFGQKARARRLSSGQEIDMVAGETTLGAIIAILGLLLAFAFGSALSQFETRKTAQIDEAAAIGTAFLRADYLPDPGRTDLQKALLAYAETRLRPDHASDTSREDLVAFMENTLQKQAVLWPLTLEATAGATPAATSSFVAGAVNEVIDMHLYRLAGFAAPVSDLVYLMVFAATMAALFLLGERAGMLGRELTWRTFVLSAFLTVLMTTIVDVQRGYAGLIVHNQTPMHATIFDMNAALAGR